LQGSRPIDHRICVGWPISTANAGDGSHPVRDFRGEPARCRLGGLAVAPARPGKAAAVGPAAHGDRRIGAHPSPRPCRHRAHPRRGAGRARGAVGDGGGAKMHRPVGSGRRAVGRPGGARLHRDPAAGGRRRAVGRPLPAGAAWRHRVAKRGAHALAGGEPAEPCQPVRPAGARSAGLGRRAVPRARAPAGPLGGRL